MRPLAAPPILADMEPLKRLLEQWAENRARATELAVEVVDIDAAVASVKQEILAWARRNPTCPLCGGAIDPEQVLSQEHAHA